MIGALSQGILTIAINMGFGLASPVSLLLDAFFPQLTSFVAYALTYVTNIVKFVPLVISLSMIPRDVFRLIFDYTIAKTLLYLGVRLYRFIINIYNKFKP